MTAWLSVDTDDIVHFPSNRGHPNRSSQYMDEWKTSGYRASEKLLQATDRFIQWVQDGPEITVFLIAEQLDCPDFRIRMEKLLRMPNIVFGCHGWGHRCWSAWPEDIESFSAMLSTSRDRISDFAGNSWRPRFRAPAGYIAKWMAAPLAAAGFNLDSSINPSRWVNRKMEGDWISVKRAIEDIGIIEVPWLTSVIGPACGPALSLFPFAIFAKRAWRKHSLRITSNPETEECVALYWHLLDHNRKEGNWNPPISKSQ